MVNISITCWLPPEPKEVKKRKTYFPQEPCEAFSGKKPCRDWTATYVRDGHRCCWVHSQALSVRWYTDIIRITLTRIRLRMLQRELEKRSKPELERRKKLVERICITCKPIMEDEDYSP